MDIRDLVAVFDIAMTITPTLVVLILQWRESRRRRKLRRMLCRFIWLGDSYSLR